MTVNQLGRDVMPVNLTQLLNVYTRMGSKPQESFEFTFSSDQKNGPSEDVKRVYTEAFRLMEAALFKGHSPIFEKSVNPVNVHQFVQIQAKIPAWQKGYSPLNDFANSSTHSGMEDAKWQE